MSIESDDVVKSVGRVFEVLELFDAQQEPLTATMIERHLNYPQSSTLALLKSMVKLGYLSFDRLDRKYLPTIRLASLGNWLDRSFHGEGHLAMLVDDLAATTGETVCISCQNDLHMQFMHVRLGAQQLILNSHAGQLLSLFHSAVGIAALTERSDPEIERMVQRYNRRVRGAANKVNSAQILQRVRKIRQMGYAIGYDAVMPGISAIAWVLKPEKGKHSLVVSVGGPSDRIKSREAHIIRAARTAIQHHLVS